MKNPFETMRASKRDIVKSYAWYMQQVKLIASSRLRPSSLLRSELGKVTTNPQMGTMLMFLYDPKLKDELPVYDRFPLVLPFRKTPDGFLGLNLHYLPYVWRARLLGELYNLATHKQIHPNMRLRLSWQLLNSSARYPGVKLCVKRYLLTHIRSPFLQVNPEDWKGVIFLPTENFEKMSKEEVFRKARREL